MRKIRNSALLSIAGIGFASATAQASLLGLGQAADFGILGLNNGTVIINSATSIVGDVGYSSGVSSTTNQKVDTFTGTVYQHSSATVNYTLATFAPSGGFVTGGAADAKLNQANLDASAAWAQYSSLPATETLGAINDASVTITSTGPVNVISIPSVNAKTDAITLNSRAGFDDIFIINVTGSFDWDSSEVAGSALTGNIIWNFPNASSVAIGKAETIFRGTILAPLGSVDYHNPASFSGSILALNINVHSDFNLNYVPPVVPEPTGVALLGVGGLALLRRRRA